jgi:tRNA-modifying protein YgfZ
MTQLTGPTHLASRGVFEVSGPDAAGLLQGQLTQDIAKAAPGSPVHGAMLTPQGKYLFDALVWRDGADSFLLDAINAEAFARRLMMFRLRARVAIRAWPDLASVVLPQGGALVEAGVASAPDPRRPGLWQRALVQHDRLPSGVAGESAYTAARLEAGIPELAEDLVAEKDFALEGLLDELSGVDFHKGCYVGQEMTSRMKRRTTVRTKLSRVRFEGAAPPYGTPLFADGWEVGQMRSGVTGVGIALVRLDRALAAVAKGETILAGDFPVRLDPPDWLVLPDAGVQSAPTRQ